MWEIAGTELVVLRLSKALNKFNNRCALSLDNPPAYSSRSFGSAILRDASTTTPIAGDSNSGLLSNTLNLSKAINVNSKHR